MHYLLYCVLAQAFYLLHLYMYVCMNHSTHMEIRDRFVGVGSLLSPLGSGGQTWGTNAFAYCAILLASVHVFKTFSVCVVYVHVSLGLRLPVCT